MCEKQKIKNSVADLLICFYAGLSEIIEWFPDLYKTPNAQQISVFVHNNLKNIYQENC